MLLFPQHAATLYAQDRFTCGQLVHPAAGPAFAPMVTLSTNLVSVGEVAYFISNGDARTHTDQKYLWRTDGTPTGTFTVTPTIADFSPHYVLAAFNDNLLLRAATPATGAELWISDGTPQGTQLLKDIVLGPVGATYSGWFDFADRFFFAVYEEGKQTWWTTDGTPEHTAPVTTFYPGAVPRNARFQAKSATEVYLTAQLSDKWIELWRLDRRGFRKVRNFIGVAASREKTEIGQAILQNDRLYFFASIAGGASGLWRSDGTVAGTTLIFEKDFAVPTDPAVENGVYPYTLIPMGNDTLFFFEYEQPLLRLWRLDSTRDRVSLVKTIRVRDEEGVYHDVRYETAITYADHLYFAFGWRDHQSNQDQTELWQSDGTAAGTQRLTSFPMTARLTVGTSQGLFLLAAPYILHVPWTNPYPTVICNLGPHLRFYPTLFYHQTQLYLSGHNAWLGTDHLWRIDPTTLRPTTVFLPVVKN